MPYEVEARDWGNRILSRLREAFQLQRQLVLRLTGTITPVLSVDDMLWSCHVKRYTLDLSGAGAVVADTVPEGEVWRLVVCSVHATTGSTYYKVLPRVGEDVWLGVGGTTARLGELYGLEMQPGGTISVEGTTEGGDSSRSTDWIIWKRVAQ